MAFETPKTDWKPESVPTEEDFNRIEKNIAHLNDAVTIGPVKSALCDQNGNNIASTYLGTSKTPLCIDAMISYLNPIKLSEYIGNYKYLIFLLKSEGGSSFFMIDREIFVGFLINYIRLYWKATEKRFSYFMKADSIALYRCFRAAICY